MKKISNIVVKHYILIFILSLICIIPSIIGMINTKINYDILVYLPDKIDTIKGEKILTNDFGLGAYAFVMIDTKNNNKILKLENNIKKINGVDKTFSLMDILGKDIPIEMVPDKILKKLYKSNETIIMVTFKDSTSSDKTVEAVKKIRKVVGDSNKVSSMTSMVLDTMELSTKEMSLYVCISVLLCLIVLIIATDSFIIPPLLLSNIGLAILYNMGTNIFLGNISYITKAITAILQLGVTTDFSIFLYHKYIDSKKKEKDKFKAMEKAIIETMQSVIGSSLTTFVGFLALCTMDLKLGTDIGLVMSKGVLFGLICVLTVFPSLLLLFDNLINKTSHKNYLPKFERLKQFSISHQKLILTLFLLLIIPAYYGNTHYKVYYKLDDALPKSLPFHVSNENLSKNFNITSPEIILLDKKISKSEVEEIVEKLNNKKGINMVISPNTIIDDGMKEILPDDIQKLINHKKYQLIIYNSEYEVASNKLNNQVKEIEKLVKKYDKNGIVAGEGALMKDLVEIADHDFKMVNTTSILIIFLVMVIVLQSIGLPIILIITIEFAIFSNLAISYYTNVSLPFIASIVVGTIQLGATIDYAILMSTKYLEERNKKIKKEKAMENTLKETIPSIITSAACFFSATIGVTIITKIDMIGSICTLLSRGALISMIVVIIVLPTLLVLSDSFILKTTKRKKV